MRLNVVVFGLAMLCGGLCGCAGSSWYNPENPYVKPGSSGTPADRTGGTAPGSGHKLYPGWSVTHLSGPSKEAGRPA